MERCKVRVRARLSSRIGILTVLPHCGVDGDRAPTSPSPLRETGSSKERSKSVESIRMEQGSPASPRTYRKSYTDRECMQQASKGNSASGRVAVEWPRRRNFFPDSLSLRGRMRDKPFGYSRDTLQNNFQGACRLSYPKGTERCSGEALSGIFLHLSRG